MDKYQPTAKYDLAETCAASISLHDLIELSENKAETTRRLEQSAVKLTYGDIRGSDALRNNLASLYSARASGMVKGRFPRFLSAPARSLMPAKRQYSDYERGHRSKLSGFVFTGPR